MIDTEFDQKSAAHTSTRVHARRHRASGVDRIQTTIWLEPSDHASLGALAEVSGITKAEAVEKLIRREMSRREKRMEQAQAA